MSRRIRFHKNCDGLCGLVAILLLSMSSGGLAWAQETPPDETEDTSKRVEESEENYRQRMELREQRFNERPKITTTYAVQASEGKLDQLPPASREHIKDQLRDMIIESRQWKPGEDITDYPYEPSAAAKTDPALHALEREAWVEQLQKHQEREAAAFANATGGEAGQPAAQEGEQGAENQAQGQSEQGSGEKAAQISGGSPGASSQDQTGVQDDSESATGSERAAKAISTAGVSESALSFVQGKGGRGGAATPGNASAGGAAQGSAQDASQAASPEGGSQAGSQAGAQDAAQLAQATNAGSSASASSAAGAGQQAAEEKSAEEKAAEEKLDEQAAAAEVLAGTLAIDELQKVEGLVRQDAGQQPGAGGDTPVAGVEGVPLREPGTLSIDELKELKELEEN